jgi:uncharacterized DUF497 family protein
VKGIHAAFAERIRLFSARKATRLERNDYEEKVSS